MRRSARVVLAVGAVLLAHIPASGQSGWEPPAGRKCDPAFAEFRVPSLEQAADSAALLRDLASYLSGSGQRPKLIMLGVDYEKSGGVKRVSFAADVPKEDQRALSRTFSSHLKALPAQEKAFSIGLQIAGGSDPRVQLYPVTVTCSPALKNAARMQTRLTQEANFLTSQGYFNGDRRRKVTIRMRLTRTGEAADTEVIEGSGIPAIDQAALRVTSAMEFLPAILGKEPVDVWVTQPITFSVQSAAQ